MAWNFPWIWNSFKAVKDNLQNGYQFGDITRGWYGFHDNEFGHDSTVSDNVQEMLNDHNISAEPDVNGYQQVDITPSDPTSSAANVINHDPNKSAQENMLGYAKANNSASAYAQYLANQHEMEMSNTAISRAIADAEANGISKYQLFQSGNMAASTPSSGSSMYQSYENAMNRRESYNEKELAAITAIIVGTMSAASKLIGK